MEGYLKPYKKKKVKSVVPLAKPFKRPKKVEFAYDAGEDRISKRNIISLSTGNCPTHPIRCSTSVCAFSVIF